MADGSDEAIEKASLKEENCFYSGLDLRMNETRRFRTVTLTILLPRLYSIDTEYTHGYLQVVTLVGLLCYTYTYPCL